MNDKKIKKAIALYAEGMSIQKSASEAGVARTTLQRHLKKMHLTRHYTKQAKDLLDLVGSSFGNLTVVSHVVEDQGRVLWVCRCECGNEQKIRQSELVSGKKEMCGNCLITKGGNPRWKGCGELSGTYWKRLKSNALRRASGPLKFSISIQYAWKLYCHQDGKCALTGQEIPFPKKVEDGFVASLDRIDSSKGYVDGNVQWVHKDVNLMKWNLDQDYFFQLCEMVINHRRV